VLLRHSRSDDSPWSDLCRMNKQCNCSNLPGCERWYRPTGNAYLQARLLQHIPTPPRLPNDNRVCQSRNSTLRGYSTALCPPAGCASCNKRPRHTNSREPSGHLTYLGHSWCGQRIRPRCRLSGCKDSSWKYHNMDSSSLNRPDKLLRQ